MNTIDHSRIQEMVAHLKTVAAQASPAKAAAGPEVGAMAGGKVDFGDVLKATLGKVSAVQNNAEKLGERFALGDNTVNLSDVMIADQKANIAMQATLQVRNRLVSAYTTMINMPV